jgi:hypothetical protein
MAERITPLRLESPAVGLRPTMALCDAGIRIDPLVSVPMAHAAKFAAVATPEPPLDPPGARVRSYGFNVCPP